MKKLLYMSMAFVAIMGLTACGSDSSSDDNTEKKEEPVTPPTDTKTYEQTVELTAAAGEKTVTMKGLQGAVTVNTYERDWADVNVNGTQATVKADANNTYKVRSLVFILKDEKGNTLRLTVKQAAKEQSTEVDEENLNNQVSDWPSLSRG